MHTVKRKGTQATPKVPNNFGDVKKAFLSLVGEAFSEPGNLPLNSLINFDQTGV